MAVRFYDAAAITSRIITETGMLRAPAVVTRAGLYEYDAADLGVGPNGERVTVWRTRETVGHRDTLASLRGLPITIDHPEDGVGPENYSDEAVGSIAGEPSMDGDGLVHADVLIGDGKAIKALDKGKKELSLGYSFHFRPSESDRADYETFGPLISNHMAMVDRGRAGRSVKVADAELQSPGSDGRINGDGGEIQMTAAEMTKAVTDALDAWDGGKRGTDTAAIAAALKPVLDQMASTQKAVDDAEADRKAAEAKAKAKTAADKLVEDTANRVRGEERARASALADAAKVMDSDALASVQDSDAHDILVAAVGDAVPNAKDADDGYLRGALAMMARDGDRRAEPSEPSMPRGVGRSKDSGTKPGFSRRLQDVAPSGSRDRDSAYDAYVSSLTDAWKDDPRAAATVN